MKSRAVTLVLLALVSIFFSSCELDEFPSWQPQVLAPVATSKVNVKELADVEDKVFQYSLPSSEIGFPSGYLLTVPPIDILSIGPNIFTISEFHESVEVQTAEFVISITNAFPISISPGTRLVFRNDDDSDDPGNIIYEHHVSREILPNDSYTFTTDINNKVINSNIYFYMENFQSPGGADVVFSPNGIDMRFELTFLEIKLVKILTNQGIEVTQNIAISLVDENNGPEDDLATGNLGIFLTNELPLNIGFQVYFYGEDGVTIIDSLFQEFLEIEGGSTDNASGNSVNVAESEAAVLLSESKMSNIKRSDRVKMRFNVNTDGFTGTSVAANKDLNFEFQVVGDLKLNVQL